MSEHERGGDGELDRLNGALRSAVAGGEAARVASAAAVLFEAGGKRVLGAGTQKLVRDVAQKTAATAIANVATPLVGVEAEKQLLSFVTKDSVKAVARQSARAAGSQVLRGAGRAAGIGFVLDGAIAGVEATLAVRRGAMDTKTAVKHVAAEATTGALATATGVLLGAGLVALTGGVAAPVVFAVGAFGAMGTKKLLRGWVREKKIA